MQILQGERFDVINLQNPIAFFHSEDTPILPEHEQAFELTRPHLMVPFVDLRYLGGAQASLPSLLPDINVSVLQINFPRVLAENLENLGHLDQSLHVQAVEGSLLLDQFNFQRLEGVNVHFAGTGPLYKRRGVQEMADLHKYMSKRRKKIVKTPETMEIIFDPRDAFFRVQSLIQDPSTAYVCGCLKELTNERIIAALETKMGVQIILCAKGRSKNPFLYRKFRQFRGHPIRSIGNKRSPSVDGSFLIGLTLDNRCSWVYVGHTLHEDQRGINTSIVLHKEDASPWVAEYLRLFGVSEV